MESRNLPFRSSESTRTAGCVGCQRSLRHPLGRSFDQTPAGAKQQDEGYCISAALQDFWILEIPRRLVHYCSCSWVFGCLGSVTSQAHQAFTVTSHPPLMFPLRGRDNTMPECELQPGCPVLSVMTFEFCRFNARMPSWLDEGRQSEVNLWWNVCLKEQIDAGLRLELWASILWGCWRRPNSDWLSLFALKLKLKFFLIESESYWLCICSSASYLSCSMQNCWFADKTALLMHCPIWGNGHWARSEPCLHYFSCVTAKRSTYEGWGKSSKGVYTAKTFGVSK